MSNEAIKPCPFCGGTEQFVERADYSSAYVQCDSRVDEHSVCMARGPIAVQDDDGEEVPGAGGAVAAWNRRTAHVEQGGAEPVAWANWKVGSKSYVPYRTQEAAAQCVRQSAIAATQEGPYEVVPLYTHPAPVAPVPEAQIDCYCGGWDDITGSYHQLGCPEVDKPTPSAAVRSESVGDEFEKWKAWYSAEYTSFIPMHEGEPANLDTLLSWKTWQASIDARTAAPAVPEVDIERVRELHAKLEQWRLCMSYNDSYFGEPAGLVKSIVRELTYELNPGADGNPLYAAPQPPAAVPKAWRGHFEESAAEVATWPSWKKPPAAVCRDDGRCQYAIDHGAEGLGHCPDGKCCMPPAAVAPEPATPFKVKGHVLAAVVNNLRDVAVEFHATGQLRERIKYAIAPLVDAIERMIAAAPVQDTSVRDAAPGNPQVISREEDQFGTRTTTKYTLCTCGGAQSVALSDAEIGMLKDCAMVLCDRGASQHGADILNIIARISGKGAM